MAEEKRLPIEVTLRVEETARTYTLRVDTAIQIVTGDHYEGPIEVTPAQQTQTLQTEGLLVDSDITINPIPSNYGLITWNGSVLTVS